MAMHNRTMGLNMFSKNEIKDRNIFLGMLMNAFNPRVPEGDRFVFNGILV